MPHHGEPYRPRAVRFLEQWEPVGWRIKVYGIAYARTTPGGRLVEAARSVARARLPTPAVSEQRYGVGFMGVHEGRGSNLVFVDWWADENELHHHVFVSYPGAPDALTDVTHTGLVGCVWDLAVLAFERRAWIDTTLLEPGRQELDRYLGCRFQGAV